MSDSSSKTVTMERQTLAGAYAKIENHEDLCAERYKGINEKLHLILLGLGTLFLGLLSWMAVQLYTLEPLRIAAAAAHSSSQTVTTTSSKFTAQAAP